MSVQEMPIGKKFLHAQSKGVPLLAISTVDNADTEVKIRNEVEALSKALADKGKPERHPIIRWDFIRGFLPSNNDGIELLNAKDLLEKTAGNPVAAVMSALKEFPPKTVLLAYNFHNYVTDPGVDYRVVQAVQIARDGFKKDNRILVLLGFEFDTLAEDLNGDVIRYEDPLPTQEQLKNRMLKLYNSVEKKLRNIDPEASIPRPEGATLKGLLSAANGLPMFMAEQAMSLSFNGDHQIDEATLWTYKDTMLDAVDGLSVYRSDENFGDLGGMQACKDYFNLLVNGSGRPSAFFWLDEPEKSGLASTDDTSGVNKDQLGTSLQMIENFGWRGVVILGGPGVAKSQFVKCLNGEYGIPVLAGDMGACKHEYVGRSERNIRRMFKTVHQVGGSGVVVILTANSVAALDDALKSRFPKMYYAELPTPAEKQVIWGIWTKKCGLEMTDVTGVDDDGWSGRNIKNCCREAQDTGLSLKEASVTIVPEEINSAESLDRIRKFADGKLLSASYTGLYKRTRAELETEARGFMDN